MRAPLGALALAALLAACGGEEAGGSASTPGRGPGERPPAPVQTAVVERSTVSREVEISGVVEPIRSVGVNSQLATTVVAVGAEEGDRVGTGQVLARLDAAELEAELVSAEAAHEVARAAWERARRLRDRQIITLPEYERDRAALAAAEAALTRLRTRISYATVRAPIAGTVTVKDVEAGDLVAPQQQLFRIADVSTLVVPVGVSELDVVEVAAGHAVEVALDAYPDRPLRGRVRRVFPTADPATRLVRVEIALEPGSPARPGFLARVGFDLDVRADVPVVPAGAVVESETGPAVFVVREGRALRRPVELGVTHRGRVEVVDGVAPGEVVVVQGASALSDGAPVRPVEGGIRPEGPRLEDGR